MTSRSASIAWRNSLRARALPASRWAQRPSAFLPRAGTVRYASDSAAAKATEAVKEAPKEIPQEVKEIPKRAGRKSRKGIYGTSLAVVLLAGYLYGTDTRASVHRYGLVPLIRMIYPDAEDAHHAGVDTMKLLYQYGLHPRERGNQDGDGALSTEVCFATSSISWSSMLMR
jgi:dihydroorotate dehydrogenase